MSKRTAEELSKDIFIFTGPGAEKKKVRGSSPQINGRQNEMNKLSDMTKLSMNTSFRTRELAKPITKFNLPWLICRGTTSIAHFLKKEKKRNIFKPFSEGVSHTTLYSQSLPPVIPTSAQFSRLPCLLKLHQPLAKGISERPWEALDYSQEREKELSTRKAS